MEYLFNTRVLIVVWVILLVLPRPFKSERPFQRKAKSCRKECMYRKSDTDRKVLMTVRGQPFTKCYKQCLSYSTSSKNKKPYPDTGPDFIILGPNEAVPDSLIQTDQVQRIPKKLSDLGNPLFKGTGNCAQTDLQVFSKQIKTATPCVVTSVSYIQNTNNILIQWDYPQDLRKVTGYQIIYYLTDMSSPSVIPKSFCYVVDKTKKVFTIDSSKGFTGQNEIHLRVIAIPLPLESNMKMRKYSIHLPNKRQTESRKRNIRDTTQQNITKPDSDTVILGPDDTLPPDLIMPSVMPQSVRNYLRRKTNSNCSPPEMYSNKTVYAGQANIRGVNCQLAGKFTKKGFNVYWELPKDYLNTKFDGYQIYYSIMPRTTYDPERQFCVQVSQNIQSYTITNVESTDTVHLAVLAYPVYDNITFFLKKFKPCSKDPTKKPIRNTDKPKMDGNSPFRIEAIIGIVAVIVICIIVAVFMFRLRRNKGFSDSKTETSGFYYVSYYPDTKNYHNSLLHLVAKVRKVHSLDLIMDSMCRTQIDQLGMPRWCIQRLSEAEKVIIVMSKDYLKICQEWQRGISAQNPSIDANRVCLELQYVVNTLFEKRKNTNVLIILADVKANELPDILRNRPTINWPKGSDELNSLACSICNVEEVKA